MALRERNDCTDEGLVPRALAIHSSLRSSSTQRRMSSVNFLSDTLLFMPTRATPSLFWGVAGCATGSTRPKRCPTAGRASVPLPSFPSKAQNKAPIGRKQPSVISLETRILYSPECVEGKFCELRQESFKKSPLEGCSAPRNAVALGRPLRCKV